NSGRSAGAFVRCVLHLVVQRLELQVQRELYQPVRQPDVLRQQRAVKVGSDHVSAVYSLEAVATVVAVAAQHTAERVLAGTEVGAAAVVLESGDHPRAAAEVRLDRAVADQPRALLAHGPE